MLLIWCLLRALVVAKGTCSIPRVPPLRPHQLPLCANNRTFINGDLALIKTIKRLITLCSDVIQSRVTLTGIKQQHLESINLIELAPRKHASHACLMHASCMPLMHASHACLAIMPLLTKKTKGNISYQLPFSTTTIFHHHHSHHHHLPPSSPPTSPPPILIIFTILFTTPTEPNSPLEAREGRRVGVDSGSRQEALVAARCLGVSLSLLDPSIPPD